MSNILYCPVCGHQVSKLRNKCLNCATSINPIESKNDMKYYVSKSIETKGNYSFWYQILLEEEIMKNPNFLQREYERVTLYNQFKKDNEVRTKQNIPKCPTCGSTNIKNLSSIKRATHALAFGLFSKTARSQFECLNCHYKW